MAGETEFKKWFVKNANGRGWLAQTIETSTGAGVPDVFLCTFGRCTWAELKSTTSNKIYMRISQFRWFVRFISRGGVGFLIIKRLRDRRIDVYKASDLTVFSDAEGCVLKGDDIYFPEYIQPAFSYKLGIGAGTFFNRLLRELQK